MQNITIEVANFLVQNDNFLIVTHERPDGDALGSSFALLNILKENGKNAALLLPEELPENYLDFVPCDYRTYLDQYERTTFSWCLALDNTDLERAAVGMRSHLADLKLPIVNIDHHPDNRCFGKINLIIPEAAATAEIVFRIVREIPSWKISPKSATLLLLGIIMDTGGFRFDNTSAEVLNIAAELLRLKADHHGIVRNMFFSKHLPYVQFEAELITRHLKVNQSGRFGWICIPEALIERYGIDMKNSEGLIEGLRSISGMDIVALLQRREDGFKISLRSKDARYSVGKIARQLNGGGHELAAGCMIKTDKEEVAENILLAHVERILNEI
ncbi:MAG: bifunctional oligoribonuclease/PAP phosphatase NrnA [Victivallales bacterium]|nr:bifunctional oligoribonuclease/PAP phosphatase NrnA [Victivallales bacterium]